MNVLLRPATFSDYRGIIDLMNRYDLGDRTEQQWRHLWEMNPAREGLTKEWPIGWVLETEGGQIVGSFGNVPEDYELDGKPLVAAAAFSWVVDQPYRRQYAHSLLGEFCSQKGPAFLLNTSANPRTSKVFAGVGFEKVPVGDYGNSFFWITDHQKFAASTLLQKKIPVASALKFPLGLALKFVSLMKSHTRTPRRLQDSLRFVPGFDERFEDFWHKQRARARGLTAVRDRRHLEWHYKYSGPNQTAWVVTHETGGTIQAYGVFFKQDNPSIGLNRLRLADFQSIADQDGAEILLAMIEVALARCPGENIHMLEVVGFRPEITSRAQAAAPYRRPLPTWLYYYKTESSPLQRRLADPDLWDPSFYDGDITL